MADRFDPTTCCAPSFSSAGSTIGIPEKLRPEKSVVTRSDVLQINEQDIEIFQHLCGRLAMFAVQTMNRNVKTRMLITSPFHHVVLRLAEKPMLRAEKGRETKKITIVSLENSRRMLELT